MSFAWFYRKLVNSYLNKPAVCADNDKNNESGACPKYEGISNVKSSADLTNQWKETPMFKKKYVYYFSPTNFTMDDSSTLASLYKFYLQTLLENDPRYKTDTNSFKVAKTIENEESDSNLQDKKHNVQEESAAEKYVASCAVAEKQFMFPLANKHSPSPLSHVLNILHYYLIFPFYVSKKIFDVDSRDTGYYCVRFEDTPDADTHDIDIYTVDDETYENFCLQVEEENVESHQCCLLPTLAEFENEDTKMNSDYDQKDSFLFSKEVYRPFYRLEGETQDNTSTSNHCETNYNDNECTSFMDKYLRNIQMDKENDVDEVANIRKFKSSFDLEKYDLLFAQFFRKLATRIDMKLKDIETGSKTED